MANKVWEPEYRYESVSGKFNDYRGNERDFTMVAVSIPVESMEKDVIAVHIPWFDDGNAVYNASNIEKLLAIGVAVRSMSDKDNGLGERIAYGKAVKYMNHVLYVTHSGMVNTKMVKALLEQEAEHFKKDPGSYLTSYNADKEKFVKTGKIACAEKTMEEINKANLVEYFKNRV